MRGTRALAWWLTSALVSLAACSSFDGVVGVEGADAGEDAAFKATEASAPPVDASVEAATFCGRNANAIFCDDFEGDDLAERWPIADLQLGLANVIDGTAVGRPGSRVLRFARTKEGGPGEDALHLRRQLGAVMPVRVAYDLQTNDWPIVPGISAMTCGNSVHGGLYSWLSLNGESKVLSYLAYTGDSTFYDRLALSANLHAPVNRWEHYEVVTSPGPSTHFELWVGVPPVKVADDTVPPIAVPNDAGFSPTYVEIGFTRSNAGPMPAIEGYYDNVLVTTP